MSAKKSLKKLKKKLTKPVKTVGIQELNKLKRPSQFSSANDDQFKHSDLSIEFKDVVNSTALSMLSELSSPLKPLISWLNDENTETITSFDVKKAPDALKKHSPLVQTKTQTQPKQASGVNLYVPLKAKPCKGCPALSGGMCKCASKKYNR